jgi:hypothetical protein
LEVQSIDGLEGSKTTGFSGRLVNKQAKPSKAPVTWLAWCEGVFWVAWLATACKALGSSELSLGWGFFFVGFFQSFTLHYLLLA